MAVTLVPQPRARRRLLLVVTLPAVAIAVAIAMGGLEIWARHAVPARRGSPTLFLADPMRAQRLAPDFNGWFAGVPVRVNSLGFRDDREYPLAKGPRTFRILVLGDSVTFGHGSLNAHTYPALLERMLKEWRADVDWQVWNLGVPGYNTSQELAHLLQVGPQFKPDLVVVGFFPNDIVDNQPVREPGRVRVLASAIMSAARRHLYSLDVYRKLYLTFRWRLSASSEFRRQLVNLASQDALLADVDRVADLKEQALTPYERLPDEQVRGFHCQSGQTFEQKDFDAMVSDPGWANWVAAVRGFQELNTRGTYRIAFFLNMVPRVCPSADRFYEDAERRENDLFLEVMGAGTPAFSVFDAFLHRLPSQMPMASAHAIGNSNMTKAETLFAALRDHVLPGLLR